MFEAHDLQVGQTFSFEPNGRPLIVDSIGIIDYEGHDLVLYRDDDGLHGHYRDHTPVWVFGPLT